MNGHGGGTNISCPVLIRFVLQQGVVPVLDKPLNKGKSGVGWSWRPFVCRSWSMASFNPSWFPGVICKLLSIGIAVFLAGHDSFIPVIV